MFRKIISILSVVLVIALVWFGRDEIIKALSHLSELNVFTGILLVVILIPEQLLMYYAAAEMYFSFLRSKRGGLKISRLSLLRVSLEINFVNHIVPSGGVSGLGYLTWRLSEFKVTAGQATFMHILRYAASATAAVLQTLVSIAILFGFLILGGTLGDNNALAYSTLGLATLACIGILTVVLVAYLILRSKKRIDWFSTLVGRLAGWVNGKFKKKKLPITREKIDKFFTELHEDYQVIKHNKKALTRPFLWATVYAFTESAAFWIAAIALGHPEILPQIIIAQAISSIIGVILVTPGAVGGYELAMVGVLVGLGVNPGVATATVLITRAILLIGTLVSGYGFYQHAIIKRGGRPKAAPAPKDGE